MAKYSLLQPGDIKLPTGLNRLYAGTLCLLVALYCLLRKSRYVSLAVMSLPACSYSNEIFLNV